MRGFFMGARFGGTATLVARDTIVEGWDRVNLGHNVRLHNAVQLATGRTGYLNIGDETHIARLTVIAAAGGVSIGEHCAISSSVSIYTVRHRNPAKTDEVPIPGYAAPVTIGNRVFIGCGASILPGVTIGDNATVAAGAVVKDDVAANETVAGVPAGPVK